MEADEKKSLAVRERGLKPMLGDGSVSIEASLAVRERGLKRLSVSSSGSRPRRSLYASVD